MTMKRDVGAFKALLWRWFEAENYRCEWGKMDSEFQAHGAKETEAAASQALAAVFEAFEADAEPTNQGMPDHGRSLTAEIKACGILPPQNSRDSDFP
jgi:hypothetical protein